MKLSDSRPIFTQIMAWVEDNILRGDWQPGYQLPSVREMSGRFTVNNNTIVRTYEHLTLSGTIYSQRGVGYFVSPDARESILSRRREEFYSDILPYFINQIEVLGISPDEISSIIKRNVKNEEINYRRTHCGSYSDNSSGCVHVAQHRPGCQGPSRGRSGSAVG